MKKDLEIISESEADLLAIEHKQKRAMARDRVRFIRFLKNQQAHSQAQAGELIGLSPRQSQRLWRMYCQKGIAGLIEANHGGQYKGKLSALQIEELKTYLRSDDVSQLSQAQTYLKENLGINYSLSGLSILFARHTIKLKTARPSNVRQAEGAVESFKKTLGN